MYFLNDSLVILALVFLVVVILISIGFVIWVRRPDENWREIVKSKLIEIQNNPRLNLENRIIEYDKLLEYTLQNNFRCYRWNLGKILKKKSKNFTEIELDNIWFAHKTRNQIVHDIHYQGNLISLENSANTLIRYCRKYSF